MSYNPELANGTTCTGLGMLQIDGLLPCKLCDDHSDTRSVTNNVGGCTPVLLGGDSSETKATSDSVLLVVANLVRWSVNTLVFDSRKSSFNLV